LNKKMQKGIVAAVAATMGTGIVAPVYAASAETTDINTLYKAAYDATVKAEASKVQKDLTVARELIDALYAALPAADKSLAATFSQMLDPIQHDYLVKTVDGIAKAKETLKQADVNSVRALFVDMPKVWKETYSAALDQAQQAIHNNVVALVQAAQKSGLQADLDKAKAAYADLLTSTNEGFLEVSKAVIDAELAKVTVELKVVSVKALNLKQLEVKFNKVVDADTAEDEDNYSLDADNAVLTGGNFELSKDGKTVKITLATEADNQDVADLTVSGVQDEAGKAIAKTTVNDITFLDVTMPEAISAAVVGNDTIKVTFSEPIETVAKSNFKVNDGDLYIKNITQLNNNTEVNIELYSALEEGKVTVEVGSGIEDYAGFSVLKTELSANVTVDEAAPVVVGFKDASPTSVTLVFNEEIEIDDATLTNYYHTNTNNVADSVEVDGKELTLDFSSNPLPAGTAYVYILKESVNDLWDNLNDKVQYKVEVTEDKTAPVLEDFDVNAENEVELTFSEDIAEAGVDNFTLLDEDGEEVEDIIDGVLLSGDKITLTFSENLAGDYTLVVKDLEDEAGNEIADITRKFTVDDLTAPLHSDFSAKIYNPSADGQMIKVNFGEKMATTGAYSVTDLSKYVIGGEKLEDIEGAKITVVDSGKGIEILVPSVADDDDNGVDLTATDDILMGRVADAAGNYTTALSATVGIDVAGDVEIDTVEAVDTHTIKVTFTDLFASFDANDIALSYNDGSEEDLTVSRVSTTVNEDGVTVATFKVSETLNYDGTYGSGNDTVYARVIDNNSENKYGETLNVSAIDVDLDDKIAPAIAKDSDSVKQVYVLDVDGNEVSDTIVIEYTEAMESASVTKYSYQVAGRTVTAALVSDEANVSDASAETTAADGKFVVISLSETDIDADTSVTPAVTQKYDIFDANGNKLAASATSVSSIDGIASEATIVSAAYTKSTNTLVLTGTNFNTEFTSGTNVKGLFDWSKIAYDIDTDNTGNITFTAANITSAVVTNDTTVTIVLASAKAAELEGATGFGGVNDDIIVTDGFVKDAAENASTSDGNPAVNVTVNN
jgi:hypothetical protein